MHRGKFVVITGPDGAGKTTLMGNIKNMYPDLIPVREPGGTTVAEVIRAELLSDSAKDWHPMSQLLHYFGARANLLEWVIRPTIEGGNNVIADRFDESTFAYQVRAFNHPELEMVFWEIRRQLTVNCQLSPDLYIFIDVPVEVGMRRRKLDGKVAMNHLDSRNRDFHNKVNLGLQEFIEKIPRDNVRVVNGNRPHKDVLLECLKILRPLFGKPSFPSA